MRLILITFIACVILLAYPEIVHAARNKAGKETSASTGKTSSTTKGGSKKQSTGSDSKAGSGSKTPTTPTKDKKKGSKTQTDAPKSSPPAGTASSPSEEQTIEPVTRDKCPSKPESCSNSIKGLSTCCYEEYGVHLFSVQWDKTLNQAPGFTIHGLWPNTCANGPAPPSGCGKSDRRLKSPKVTEILKKNGLLDQMNTYWPSRGASNGQFWMEEWNKHGTCASTLSPECYPAPKKSNADAVEYFGRALELNKKYDFYTALKEGGVVPDDKETYTPKQITDAIEKKYNIAVDLRCNGNVLSEIRTFFNVKDITSYVPIAIPKNEVGVPKKQCTGDIVYPAKNPQE